MPGALAAQRPADARSLDVIGRTLAQLDRALAGFFHPALAQKIVWDVREAPALLKYVDYLDSTPTENWCGWPSMASPPSSMQSARCARRPSTVIAILATCC